MTFEEYVEFRLQEWADWFRGGKLGKGYPSESSINLFRNGVVINNNKYQRHHFLPVNEAAEEIEKIIVALVRFDNKIAAALKKYYLGTECTTLLKAKALGLSETTFKKYVEMAKVWVSAKLAET